MSSADLIAIFSYAPGSGSLIAITPIDDAWNALATARPAGDTRPVDALRAMGYRLTHPDQASYSLGRTMAATSYAKLRVLPLAT
jgi:hypothetical protein